MRVLVTDGAAPLCGEILRDSGIEVVENHEINAAELARQIGDFDGIVLRSRSKITAETLAQPGRLKVIGRAGAGVDNIDIKAARGKNIHVMNTPGGNTNAVAELAIAYLFALVRHLPRATATLRDGLWEKKKLAGSEIAGKTLGLIGYGKIGRQVALKAIALGMHVHTYDPLLTNSGVNEDGAIVTTFEQIIENADFVSLHLPKTKETLDLIDAEIFRKMKKSAYLINCARGGIVNEDDLLAAVERGDIKGAALDVFSEEPLQKQDLFTHPAIIGSPHIGASTAEAQINVAQAIAEQIAEFLNGGEARNVVN
jgi:D-3-phosphoglycerate dehydrogenase